jgi:hypothetical protein
VAAGHVASATSGSQASVASFNIGTLGTGARAGIVFVATHGTGDLITGVTWNGVAMSLLYRAADTDTEPGSVVAYFLDNVTNGTITVSRTNNAVVTVGYAASISTGGAAAVVTQTITRVSSTQNTNANTSTTGTGASGEVAVDDGSRGVNSIRYAAAFTGAATPVAQGTNSTTLHSLDSTAFGSSFVRETNAGQGSRNVGFATGTTDDWALVAVAVSEQYTATGAITHPATTVSGTGNVITPVTGTGAITTSVQTVVGTGVETLTATGAVTTAATTTDGAGAEVFTATGAVTTSAQTVEGTGAEVFTSTGAVSLAATTTAGTGEHTETEVDPEGTGAVSLPAATVAGTGALVLTGTGAPALAAITTAGTGVETFTATGAVSAAAATVAGTGTHITPVTGTGAIAASALTVAGSALHIENVTGTGAIALPSARVAGTGVAPSTDEPPALIGHPRPRIRRDDNDAAILAAILADDEEVLELLTTA